MECDAARRLAPDVPGSAQKVLCALAHRGPLTMADLQRECGLARRTVYGAVHRLIDMGILDRQTSLRDARQTYYWLPQAVRVDT